MYVHRTRILHDKYQERAHRKDGGNPCDGESSNSVSGGNQERLWKKGLSDG